MDKNTILGLVLMVVVVLLFSWWMQPTPEQLEAQRRYNDSIAAVEAERMAEAALAETPVSTDTASGEVADSLKNAGLIARFGEFAPCAEGSEEFTTLSNNKVTLKFSNKGGRLYEAVLNDYMAYDSTNVTLFTGDENDYGFIIRTNARVIDTRDLYFTPEIDGNAVNMILQLANGSQMGIRYSLPEDSYMLKMDIWQKDMDRVIPSSAVYWDFIWDQKMRRQEQGRMFEERNSALYYKFAGDDVEHLSESGNDEEKATTSLKWIGFKNQFFSTAFIADGKFNDGIFTSRSLEEDRYLKQFHAESTIDYDSKESQVAGFNIFLGPNSYPLLSSYDDDLSGDQTLDLDKLVPLGYKFFRWINTLIVIPVFTFLGKFFSNYGVIILLLTIFIKLVLFPFTYKSYKSQARMRVLAPQIKEINDKYPGQDKAMERQRLTMDLYSKAGVNPMGGCLPLLLQMPILIAMFTFFPSSIELRGESFLWAKDLSTYDAIVSWDTYIPLITPYFGNHISLFCLLMTITNLIYTKINMQNTAGQQQMPGMKFMMYLMPVMFLVFFNNYSAGLSYYYFLSLLITIIQTYVFRKCINEEKVLAELKENQKKPRKKSGFMARLEEAQRQQQAALREQQKQRNKQQRRR